MADEKAIRQRLKEDFPHYARKCLWIQTKEPKNPITTLDLKPAQLLLHEVAERQLREKGKVRILLPKARQLGGSTYVQARMMWKTTHKEGFRGYVVAHTDESTNNMFNMAKLFYDRLPDLVKPQRDKSNAKEMEFGKLKSGYKVATGGGRDIGRSGMAHFLHVSEAAYLPNARETLSAILDCLPFEDETESWIESTSAGPDGMFWEMCIAAIEGRSDYEVVFLAWFLDPKYRKPAPAFVPTDDEVVYRDEVKEKTGHLLDDEQMMFRRLKIEEKQSLTKWKLEYPSTVEEAFEAGNKNAIFTEELINKFRVQSAPQTLTRVVVGVDPSGGKKKRNDEQGIVVGARGLDGHCYILRDGTCKKSPAGWGERVVSLFEEFQADKVVAEQNFGGEMVKHVLLTAGMNGGSYKAVTASRGKAVRAEPVAALYEQGLVHHVGCHYALENEMTAWDPLGTMPSPNRMDALVWVVTELLGSTGIRSQRTSYTV